MGPRDEIAAQNDEISVWGPACLDYMIAHRRHLLVKDQTLIQMAHRDVKHSMVFGDLLGMAPTVCITVLRTLQMIQW